MVLFYGALLGLWKSILKNKKLNMAQQTINDVEQETLKRGEEISAYCKQYEGTDKYNVAMLAIEFGYQLALKSE